MCAMTERVTCTVWQQEESASAAELGEQTLHGQWFSTPEMLCLFSSFQLISLLGARRFGSTEESTPESGSHPQPCCTTLTKSELLHGYT